MIRKLDPQDLERVMSLWLETNITAHAFIPKSHWQDNYEFVKEALPHAEVYVYPSGDTLEGFIGLDNGYIAGLFVAQASQNRGIGKRLLEHCKALHPKLTLRVYKENSRAVAFYLREGFLITVEEIDDQTGRPELVMVWEAPKEQPAK